MSDIASRKRALRYHVCRKRAALAKELGTDAGKRIRDNYFEQINLDHKTVIAGYWPLINEADVRPLLDALHGRGTPCALPVIVGKTSPLLFRRWESGDELVMNEFGIGESASSREPVTPGALLVPLVAFDRSGYRLGQGGGYYDRTLLALRADARRSASQSPLTVGIAFAGQEVDSVPHEGFDQPLDWVVTDELAISTN